MTRPPPWRFRNTTTYSAPASIPNCPAPPNLRNLRYNAAMGRPISLFSGYSNAKNRTTNYCLLALKLLYENNPKFLAEVLGTLLGEEAGGSIGVVFRQQERGASSVPDGLLTQAPLSIGIETKNSDWFQVSQLEAHLSQLKEKPGIRVLVALSASDEGPAWAHETRTKCEQVGVQLAIVSFEDLILAMKQLQLQKNSADVVRDLEAYLSEEDLLPKWRRRLDVTNCAQHFANLYEGGVYICPASGAPYSHQRSQYFGMYRKKRIEKVAMIRAVVDINSPDEALVRWKNTQEQDHDLLAEAQSKRNQYRPDEMPARVFLLGPLCDTDCRKESPGGMMQSKRYFDIGGLGSHTAEELANALRETRLDDLPALP